MHEPQLKQFGDLTLDDFREHPVWIGCHTADYDEPWYDQTDEETFRPWSGELPVDPSDGMFLVSATFTLGDGSKHIGFVTPAHEPDDLGIMQPHIFLADDRFGFWSGMLGFPREERERFYRCAGKSAADVFPLRFEAEPGLAAGQTSGVVEGFYKSPDLQTSEVET